MHLDEVRAGMVLRQPALDAKGNVLLKEGVPLTERHLGLLKAHGVTEVAAADPDMEAREVQGMSSEEAAQMVEEQFRNTDRNHPLISELMRVCRQRRQTGVTGKLKNDE